MTATYGGALRAVLLNPDRKETLDTLRDIVDHDSAWKAVDYGDNFWIIMKWLGLDGFVEFYDGLKFVPYRDFPLEEVCKPKANKYFVRLFDAHLKPPLVMQLIDVLENDSVFLEYESIVDTAILATSRHPTGKDTAFHLANKPLGNIFAGHISFTFYFHPMNPWNERFDSLLRNLHNAGIWHEIIKRTK